MVFDGNRVEGKCESTPTKTVWALMAPAVAWALVISNLSVLWLSSEKGHPEFLVQELELVKTAV